MRTGSAGRNTRMSMKWLLPYLILALLMIGTGWLQYSWSQAEAERLQLRYDEYCQGITRRLTDTLHDFQMILQGGAGVFAASEEVTREEWRACAEYYAIQETFPGIQAIGYIKVVTEAARAAHTQAIRAEGFTDYTIWPEGVRQRYAPFVYLEPFDEHNRRALGFDAYSDSARQIAMDRARDTGNVSLTAALRLVQTEDDDTQPGMLMLAPIYAHDLLAGTLNERRAALNGFVYVSFRLNDLMDVLFPGYHGNVDFEVYDGPEISASTRIYASGPERASMPRLTSAQTLDLFGHQWTLQFRSTPQLDSGLQRWTAWGIWVAGLTVSLLAFMLIKTQERTLARARDLAHRLTGSLRENEAKLRRIADNISDVVFTVDLDWNITYVTPSIERLCGDTVEAYRARNLQARFPAESREKLAARCREELEKCSDITRSTSFIVEVEHYRVDGSKADVSMHLAFIRDACGHPVGLQGVARDITARRQAEKELHDSQKRFSNAFEFAPIGMALVAPEGQFLKVNTALCAMTGYTQSELLGMRAREIIHPEDQEADQEQVGLVRAREANSYRMETRFLKKSGDEIWALLSASLVRDEEENELYFVLQMLDISDQKSVEGERNARQAVEAANRAKSAFVANMSHEIRTPLNAILGFAQILERDASLTPRQAEQVNTIARSGRHLLGLINDILDMSRIESGHLNLRVTEFCLHDLLDDLEMMVRSRAAAKGLHIIVERQDTVPRFVAADEAKIRQVLINLMGNAVKFTKVGGVAVRARADAAPDSSDSDPDRLMLVMEVEDSGPGIPEEDLERIFDAFRQADAGMEYGGTGLGLAISRRLAELLGGDLSVESRLGEGSRFRFRIPVVRASGVAEDRVPETTRVVGLAPGTGPCRILVVDDQKDNRDLLRALLEPVGFTITEATNGQEALEAFEALAPHAVLMDLRMPVMDGYEATRVIKRTPQGHDTPVIAVTASAFEDDEKAVLATGVDGYVRKPFRPQVLFEALGKPLGLRYTYAKGAENTRNKPRAWALQRGDLQGLPKDLRSAMRLAVVAGDMSRLKELIAEVGVIDDDLARGLQAIAGQYEYEKLNSLLDLEGGEFIE